MAKGDPVREHYTAIGMVAAEWAELELLIDEYSSELAGIRFHDLGACFTAQIGGAARKLDAYLSLAHQRGISGAKAALHAFARDTVPLAERRNRIIHDPWVISGDGIGIRPQRLEVTARRELRHAFIEATVLIRLLPTDTITRCPDLRVLRYRARPAPRLR